MEIGIEGALAEYETYLRSWQASETTIRARVTIARSRLRAWGWDGFTRDNIRGWLATDDKGEPRRKWTTSTYYGHMTDFTKWAVASGYLPECPMEDIKRAKQPKNLPRPLSDADVQRVLDAATPPMLHWMQFALFSGLRAFEIAKLSGEDITDAGIFVQGKGDVEAILPMRVELREVAALYPARGYMWPGREDGHVPANDLSVKVGRLFDGLGLAGSIHRLRHTYGTNLLRAGVDIRQVQTLMRHSSLTTTAGYLAVMPNELQAAVDGLPAWRQSA